jgi:hypothetical protein
VRCRTAVGWWVATGKSSGGVFGFPSLSFGDGLQEQYGPGWDVGVGGCRSFPLVGPVLGTVGGLDAGLLEQLPNKFAAFGAVVVEALLDHLRETSTRRPAMPRCSRVGGLCLCSALGPWRAEHPWAGSHTAATPHTEASTG